MADGSIYRDSMGRCDTYSNPYDARIANNDALKQHRAKIYQKDRMESSTHRMEREAWRQFLSQNSAAREGRFTLAARAGKYAFLALMLPPYLFFYGAPKWLIQNGFPFLFEMAQLASKPFQKGLAKLKEATDRLGEQVNRLGEAAKQIGTRVGVGLNKIFSPFTRAGQALQNQYHNLLQRSQGLSQFISARASHLQKAFSNLSDQLKKLSSQMTDRMRENLSALGKESYQKLVKPLHWLQSRMVDLGKQLDAGAERLVQVVKKPFEILVPLKNRLMEIPQVVTEPVGKWMNARMEGIADQWKRLSDWGKEKAGSWKEKVEGLGSKASETASKVFETVANPVIQMTHQVMHAIQVPFIAMLNPIQNGSMKFGNGIKEFAESVAERIRRLKDHAKLAGIILQRFYDSLRDRARQAIAWIIPKVKAAPKLIWKYLKMLYFAICRLIKKLIHILRMIYIWIRILMWYGWRLLREIA